MVNEVLLMNPYDGHDDRITNLIERMSGKPPQQECHRGACPIRRPVKLIDEFKINEDIQRVLDGDDVKEVMLPVLNEKDERRLVNLSKEYEWGRNPDVIINIVRLE